MAYVITSLCKLEGDCIDICPVEAIEKGEEQSFINPEVCIECDACARICPHEAIFEEDQLPSEYEAFIEKNADFFP